MNLIISCLPKFFYYSFQTSFSSPAHSLVTSISRDSCFILFFFSIAFFTVAFMYVPYLAALYWLVLRAEYMASADQIGLKRNTAVTLFLNEELNANQVGSTCLYVLADQAPCSLQPHVHNQPPDQGGGCDVMYMTTALLMDEMRSNVYFYIFNTTDELYYTLFDVYRSGAHPWGNQAMMHSVPKRPLLPTPCHSSPSHMPQEDILHVFDFNDNFGAPVDNFGFYALLYTLLTSGSQFTRSHMNSIPWVRRHGPFHGATWFVSQSQLGLDGPLSSSQQRPFFTEPLTYSTIYTRTSKGQSCEMVSGSVL